MAKPGTTPSPRQKEAVVRHLHQRWPDLLGVWAFGSRVSGHPRPDSDWDLALLREGVVDPGQLWTLAHELADLLGSPVDLVDLRRASTVLQYQIVTRGEAWWRRDGRASLYEAAILSEKTALDEARTRLLADIVREGRIYGR